jgi:hypothetical protein
MHSTEKMLRIIMNPSLGKKVVEKKPTYTNLGRHKSCLLGLHLIHGLQDPGFER